MATRELRCWGCGASMTYGGRGRPPVTCGSAPCLEKREKERVRLRSNAVWEKTHGQSLDRVIKETRLEKATVRVVDRLVEKGLLDEGSRDVAQTVVWTELSGD